MSLQAVLASLEKSLQPAKAHKAAPIGIAAHAELVELWQWGRVAEVLGLEALATIALERDDWWWSQEWLTPAQARTAQKSLAKVPGFPATLVPIATDEAGNYTCHDAQSGKLVDWDHETRKPRKLPGSLTTVFTQIHKLLTTEQRAAKSTSAVKVPSAVKAVALPAKIRVATSPILRKIDAIHKHGYDAAQLTDDGLLFAGLAYGSRNVYFGDMTSNSELCPSEPGLLAAKQAQGYVMMYGSGLACAGNTVAWRMNSPNNAGGQISLWSWDSGKLALTAGACWTKGNPTFPDKTLRLSGGWLACTAQLKAKNVIALWPCDALPTVSALANATQEVAPKTLIPVGDDAVHFALDPAGTVVIVNAGAIARFDAKSGTRIMHKKLGDLEVVELTLSPDGERTFVLTRDGELVEFDRALTIVRQVKTTPDKRYSSSVHFAPSGAWFVTCNRDWNQGGELVVWNTETLKVLTRIPVKKVNHDFRVASVVQSRVLTISPRALFDVA